jgi:hypothetical protein
MAGPPGPPFLRPLRAHRGSTRERGFTQPHKAVAQKSSRREKRNGAPLPPHPLFSVSVFNFSAFNRYQLHARLPLRPGQVPL